MKKEIYIGLSVLLAIALVYGSIAWAKRIHFFAPEVNQYKIKFSDVNGLKENDPVVIRGYTSGRVLSIIPNNNFVLVTISLDNRFTPMRDASAEVRLKELMGSKQVNVSLGLEAIPFDPNGFIPGRSALDFGSGMAMATDWFESASANSLGTFLNRVDTLSILLTKLLGSFPSNQIEQSFQEFNAISGNLAKISEDLNRRRIVPKLDSSLIAVQTVLNKGSEAMADITSLTNKLNGIEIAAIDSSLHEARQLFTEASGLLKKSNELLDKAESADGTFSKILYDKEFEQNLSLAIQNLNNVLEQIQNDKIYISVGKNKNGKEK